MGAPKAEVAVAPKMTIVSEIVELPSKFIATMDKLEPDPVSTPKM